MSINLAKEKRFGDSESLGELLERAVDTIRPGIGSSERERKREALLLARWAVRAVAELVIKEGKIKLPLEVEFASQTGGSWWSDRGYSLN